uniref:Macaca fascicularis brain cDNA, clone: QtrA-18374 n=2 Tax=Macaca TaxID=9539 RepID=I7GNX7_MACFA|nr:unnamed protein product [Macaca fascicularis]
MCLLPCFQTSTLTDAREQILHIRQIPPLRAEFVLSASFILSRTFTRLLCPQKAVTNCALKGLLLLSSVGRLNSSVCKQNFL